MDLAQELLSFFASHPRILEWAALPLTDNPQAPDFPHLLQWLAQSYHGEMDYMGQNLALRQSPLSMENWATSMVLFAWAYPQQLKKLSPQALPQIAAYAQGRDYHHEIKALIQNLDQHLQSLDPGIKLRAFSDSAPVFERSWAKELGLGWSGKNACLIHPKHGSAFFLGGFFIDRAIQKQLIPPQDFCGKCTRCIDICPTGALDQAYQVDARKCISYLTIEKKASIPNELGALMGDWLFGCDLCQQVCPWNHKHLNPPAVVYPNDLAIEEWIKLLSKGGGFQSRFKNMPLLRAGRKQLLRNLCWWLRNHPDQKLTVQLLKVAEMEEKSIGEDLKQILLFSSPS